MSAILFTGACRSGKSAMAQAWCERHGGQRLYIATACINDAEMAARATAHQAARGEGWHTLELTGDNAAGLPDLLTHIEAHLPTVSDDDSLLLDCTTLWLAGLMEHMNDAAILERVDALALALCRIPRPIAIVHNETGWGLVPEYPMGRRFRDLSGTAGQRLAAVCDAVVLAVCGLPLILKGTLE